MSSTRMSRLSRARLLILIMTTCISVACGQKDLFKAPPRGTPPQSPAPSESLTTLTLVTNIPYDVVRKVIQEQTPASVPLSGGGPAVCAQVPYVDPGGVESHDKCADVPYCDISLTRQVCGTRRQCVKLPDTVRVPSIGTRSQCVNYNWDATVTRDGESSVGKSGDAVHIEIPLRIDGKAGLGGDLAKLLSLSGKSFEAHLKPAVDVGFTLGSDWCPSLSVVPTNRWVTSASVEVIGRNCVGVDLGPLGHPEVCAGPVNVDLTSAADSAVQSQQGHLSAAASSAFSCDSIRSVVAAQWHAIAVPLNGATNAPLYLNITPKGFAFSGLKVDSDAMRLAVKVWATTRIESRPADPTLMALPMVSPFDAHSSRLSVGLNATVPYSVLVDAVGPAVRDKTFSSVSAAGTVKVHVDDVTIYPTANGLSLGVKIDANLPGHFLDTKGWVYLTGRPIVASSGSALTIENLSYATVVDNGLWQVIVTVFDGEIMKVLRDHSTVDLEGSISKSAEDLAAKINQTSIKGVKVSATIPTASLDGISLGNEAIVAAVSANMDFSVDLTQDISGAIGAALH
jgi:hypothetical protein